MLLSWITMFIWKTGGQTTVMQTWVSGRPFLENEPKESATSRKIMDSICCQGNLQTSVCRVLRVSPHFLTQNTKEMCTQRWRLNKTNFASFLLCVHGHEEFNDPSTLGTTASIHIRRPISQTSCKGLRGPPETQRPHFENHFSDQARGKSQTNLSEGMFKWMAGWMKSIKK